MACGSKAFQSFLLLSLVFSSVLAGKYLTVRKSLLPAVNSFSVFKENISRIQRRDVVNMENKTSAPSTSVYELKSQQTQLLIDWVGEGSHVVVSLIRENKHQPQTHSGVFISYDYGATFQNQSSLFRVENNASAIIANFYKNPAFTSRFVFTDTQHKYLFVTLDYGKTIWPRKLNFTPSEVINHPADASVILVHDTVDHEKKLWVSSDFGESWRRLAYYVEGYHWAADGAVPAKLYVHRGEPGGRSAVVTYSKFDNSENELPQPLISDVVEFEVKEEFLFAIKRVHLLGAPVESSLQLWISNNGGPFLRAMFPHNLPQQHYYVPYVAQGQVMVCVAHGPDTAHLYVSSVPRSPYHEVRFSLSLSRIFFFQPNGTWHNTWINEMDEEAFADLHPVAGVRGTLIASQVAGDYFEQQQRGGGRWLGPEHLTTLISFDLGGQWRPIEPPKVDAEGNSIPCDRGKDCSLHLGQQLAHVFPGTQSETILSVASSPGTIVATGTVGASLKGKTSVFLSTDAGVSWRQVLRGSYLYVLADHGGAIVAVENFRNEGAGNVLYYSTDEGETWLPHQFFDKPVRIYGLKTEPGENSTVVLLFGSSPGEHEWVVFKVDLKPVFVSKCGRDDYKSWSPVDPQTHMPLCLLGRHEVFEKRLPKANCYNDFDYDRPISEQNCPCTRQDYECDFGYVTSDATHDQARAAAGQPTRAGNVTTEEDAAWINPAFKTQACVLDTGDALVVAAGPRPAAPQPPCREGAFYNRTRGYRRVPGDTCRGGDDRLYDPVLTPCPLFEEQEFLLVSARQAVLRYDLLTPSLGLLPLPLTGLSMVIAFDFDMTNNCLYWADVVLNRILRSCFDGEHGQEVILAAGTERVEGMALDWVSRNLYIVDGANKSISALHVPPRASRGQANNGSDETTPPPVPMRRTILNSTHLDRPRGIALHPQRGLLFFTDWSSDSPKVAKSCLDGTDVRVLFGQNIVGWPNGITIDFQDDRIFFVDAKLDFIASADFNGQNMHKLVKDAERPFAVGVHKSLVYWDDTVRQQVLRADKQHGWGIAPVSNTSIDGLVDLKIYGRWSQQGSNPCGSSPCPYMCVGKPNNTYSCLCPDHMIERTLASGGVSCVCSNGSAPLVEGGLCPPPTPPCSSYQFSCANGVCLAAEWRCDGADDCGDNSDEAECAVSQCHTGSWRCSSGQCVLATWRCDHDLDCYDHSDELGCRYTNCTADQFKCSNGRCINKRWRCDAEDDCRDGSDELSCETGPHRCKRTEFSCVSKYQCIPKTWQCDGDGDCLDGSDERDCDQHQCAPDRRFQCANKQCIIRYWRCDGEADCEDGSDELNCTNTAASHNATAAPHNATAAPTAATEDSTCSSSLMFRCASGRCVPFWWRCDRLDDCGDNSDEEGCFLPWAANATEPPLTPSPASTVCGVDQFECTSSNKSNKGAGPACVWLSWLCDGERDCAGGEDEEDCSDRDLCTSYVGRDGGGADVTALFRCLHSEGCFPARRRCDGTPDCADGSDELGCSRPGSGNATVRPCPMGMFGCDGSDCLPLAVHCDSNTDCLDLSDEADCEGLEESHRLAVSARLVTNTSVSVKWRVLGAAANASLAFLPAIIRQAAIGNPAAWLNASHWSSDQTYTFTRLTPATPYLVRVFVRAGEREERRVNSLPVTTEQGVPTEVQHVEAHQTGDGIVVRWQPPLQPNGHMLAYTVSLEPPTPPQTVRVSGSVTDTPVTLAAPPPRGTNISVWVVASTVEHSSPPSAVQVVRYVTFDHPSNLRIVQVNDTSVSVAWEAVEGAQGYAVAHTRPENDFLRGRVSLRTLQPRVTISGLSPGTVYLVEVRAAGCSGDPCTGVLGPISLLPVTTTGLPLAAVGHLSARVNKQEPSSVKLSWGPPAYKRKVVWQYKILWGNSGTQFRRGFSTNDSSALTTDTSYLVRGLHACQAYLLAVMVAAPLGYGPSAQVQVVTGEDPLAPPSHVTARVSHLTMRISWQPPCTLAATASASTPLPGNATPPYYLLTITETTRNHVTHISVPGRPALGEPQQLYHEVQVEYGGEYSVVVQGMQAGARPSRPPALCAAAPIPAPRQLTFSAADSSFHWRKSGHMAHSLLINSSYVLYLREGRDCTSPEAGAWEAHAVAQPPYPCPHLRPGRVYCAAVALRTPRGFTSIKSSSIRVEVPEGASAAVAHTSTGVTVAVVLVVLALLAAVAVFIVRNRRFSRPFFSLTSSRYSRSSGTTSISAGDHILEDEDSPVIQGFSDDEPLVIA